jgi:predicted polyphosphate/ATP-dependent NAD kinase
MKKKSVGILINPIAGLGGKVGLKGSDGSETIELALKRGAKPESALRSGHAFEQLKEIADKIDIYTYGDDMGEKKLKEMGFSPVVTGCPAVSGSTADDTIKAAKSFLNKGVDLIIFAGGDGTARNIYEAVGTDVPVIGIPAGVKIHSAVYAINPKSAGLVAKEYLDGTITNVVESEVMDIDEDLFRAGEVEAKLYGFMLVPESSGRVQLTKSGGVSEQEELEGMAAYVVDKMLPDTYYIIGPGSTTKSIMDDLGLSNTLLGVDIIKDRKLIALDVTESDIWSLIENDSINAKIVVTVIGGQGYLFGRGNQQISPRIIRRVGIDNIIVAATGTKLRALRARPLLVDTGDDALDEELSGYIEVVIGYGHTSIYSVSC